VTAAQPATKAGTRPATGRAMPRKEDDRLLKAQGEFGDDTPIAHLGYVVFVRSPYAHARIVGIDVSATEQVEGYLGCLLPEESRSSPTASWNCRARPPTPRSTDA
jgi:CO/xanthine dehydrogenase Mo-binding subunit